MNKEQYKNREKGLKWESKKTQMEVTTVTRKRG